MILSCWDLGTVIQTPLTPKLFQISGPLLFKQVRYCLVPFWATREAVMPLETYPIISGRSIYLLKHLKHKNDFIQSSRLIFLVHFLATRKAMAPLAKDPIMSGRLIQLFRHHQHQNLSTISESKTRARMVQEFWRGSLRRSQRSQRSTLGLEDVINGFIVWH